MRDPLFNVAVRTEQRRGFLAQTAENSARNAQVFCTFSTTGIGEFASKDMIDFGLAFFSQPAVSYGCAIDGDALVDGSFPRATGGVFKWNQEPKRGYYTGAWLFICVDLGDLAIDHSFVFEGAAMKTVPVSVVQPNSTNKVI